MWLCRKEEGLAAIERQRLYEVESAWVHAATDESASASATEFAAAPATKSTATSGIDRSEATALLRRVSNEVDSIQASFGEALSGNTASEIPAILNRIHALKDICADVFTGIANSLDDKTFTDAAMAQLEGIDETIAAFADITNSRTRFGISAGLDVVEEDDQGETDGVSEADSGCGILSTQSNARVNQFLMSPDSLMDTLTRAEAAFGMSSHHEGACPSEEADDADGEFAPPELVALEAQLAALQVRRLELQETRRLELEASQTKMERLTSLKRQLAVLRESAREGESSGLERLRAIQNLETGWVAESGNGGDAGVDLALRESTEVEEECEVFDQRQQLGVYVMTGSEQRVVAAEAPEEQVSASAAIMTKYRDALMVQEDELSQLRNQLNELREARNALDEKKELLARVMDAREALDNNVNVPSSQRAAEVMKMFELLAEAQVGSTSGDHGDYDDCLAAPEKGGEDEGLDALEKRLDSMRTNQEALKSSNEHSGTSKSTGAAAQRESSTYPPLRSVQFDSTVHEMQSVRYDNEDEKDVLDLTVDQLMSKLAENSVPRDKESSGLSARQYTSKSALDFSSVVSAFEEQTGQSLSEHERAFLAESLAQQDSDLNDRIKRIWDGDLDAYEDVEVETFYNEGGCGAEDCGSGACTSNQCTESPIKKTPKRSGVYGCENLTDSAEVSPGRDAARLAQSLGFESVDEEQIREASSKIEEGIAQIVEHIEDLKKTQVDFRNSGHVKAYADLFSSLSGQLEQFLEARTTITQFKEVLQKQQAMKRMDSISSEVAGAAEQKQAGSPGNTESERTSFQFMKRPAPIQTKPVEQNSYRMREELDFDNIRTVEITSQPNINDADTESDSDLERTLDAKERLSYSGRCGSTYSWIEPADIDEIEVSESLRRADEIVDDRLKQSMHRTAPKFSDAKATVPKAPSRLEQVTSAHSKRLYGQVKDSIYRGAANTISKFESEPHFLVNTFKGLQKLDTPFLRQKFMLVLESLMEERDQILTEAETEEGISFHEEFEDEEIVTDVSEDELEQPARRGRTWLQVEELAARHLSPMEPSPVKQPIIADDVEIEWNFSARISHCVSNLILDSRHPSSRFSDSQILILQNFLLGLIHAELNVIDGSGNDRDELEGDGKKMTLTMESIGAMMDDAEYMLRERLGRYVGLHVHRVRRALVNEALECVKEILQEAKLIAEADWARKAEAEEEAKFIRRQALMAERIAAADTARRDNADRRNKNPSIQRWSKNEAASKESLAMDGGRGRTYGKMRGSDFTSRNDDNKKEFEQYDSGRDDKRQREIVESMLRSIARSEVAPTSLRLDQAPIVIRREEAGTPDHSNKNRRGDTASESSWRSKLTGSLSSFRAGSSSTLVDQNF